MTTARDAHRGSPRPCERGHLLIDAQRENAQPTEGGLPLFVGELAPANQNGERVRHLQRPQRRHFEDGSAGDGVQHRRGIGRGLRGMHPADRDRGIGNEGARHNLPSSIADRTSR
ncbi:MAG TPA: hypothetical protein VFP80_03605, partial [Thermoanaerobaculia bacterium]|nr:hypothetical protein [Thermoanaerobaculia bacterium]